MANSNPETPSLVLPPPPALPTIHVDTRERERPHPDEPNRKTGTDMLKLFREHHSRPVCVPDTLYAGDFCFVGNGQDGPVQVGVERKRIYDLITSIRFGRLSGEQIPKLLDPQRGYDYSWIVVEGTAFWKMNYYSGLLEVRRGRDWVPLTIGKQTFLGLEIQSALNDIMTMTPIQIHFSRDEQDTVQFVLGLAHSFHKPYESRHHHVGIHRPGKYATVGKASTVRRVANVLHNVGWERSGSVEQNFPSVARMCGKAEAHECLCPICKEAELSAVRTWKSTPGFGKVLSGRTWDQLHGRYDPGVIE